MAMEVYSERWGPNNRMYWGTAAPSSVTDGDFYQQGDIMWNTAPAAGGAPGWVCTTSATKGTNAGTWKAMANLAA